MSVRTDLQHGFAAGPAWREADRILFPRAALDGDRSCCELRTVGIRKRRLQVRFPLDPGIKGQVVDVAARDRDIARHIRIEITHESAVDDETARLRLHLEGGRIVFVQRLGMVKHNLGVSCAPCQRRIADLVHAGFILEGTVLDHFGIDAAFACTVDLLEEDAVQKRAGGDGRFVRVDGDAFARSLSECCSAETGESQDERSGYFFGKKLIHKKDLYVEMCRFYRKIFEAKSARWMRQAFHSCAPSDSM